MAQGQHRWAPRWAVVCAVLGSLLMLGSGSLLVIAELTYSRLSSAIPQADLFQEEAGPDFGEDIEGPLNILLAGLDTRPSRPHEVPLADAIMIVHVTRDLDQAYLISFPRDALVDIPPEPATGYLGGRERLNHAMARGAAQVAGEAHPNVERGFALLARTLSNLTGIETFDAGVVVKFQGFEGIVDALGGVTVRLEERIVSRHRQPDGVHRPVGCGSYCGPQMVYEPGSLPCGMAAEDGSFACDLTGWQALDVVRQRYGVTGSDYGRQRNQQTVMKAMLDKAFDREIVTNPLAINRLIGAAGDAMIFDGRGRHPIDFAFALQQLRPSALITLTLSGANVGSGDGYLGEQLTEETMALFEALRVGQLDQFVLEHPSLLG